MELKFTKMHGCGNDYIYFNCFETEIKDPEALSVRLSDRHTGVGGDGIILIMPSDTADAKMRIFNIDGSEGKMCGNGIRCVAKFLYENGICRKQEMTVETLSGKKTLCLAVENKTVTSVKVDMGAAGLRPDMIPVNLTGDNILSRPVTVGGEEYKITCVSVGNPHAVIFREDIDEFELREIGPLFENDAIFPEKVNAEFTEVTGKNKLKMRVWERGSGETRACGTGACAAAVAAVLNGLCEKNEDITVQLPGGELVINYTDEAVYMTGDCVKVFEGTVEI